VSKPWSAAGLTLAGVCVALAACGSSGTAAVSQAPTISTRAIPRAATLTAAAHRSLMSWPEFGLDPQRSDSSEARTGITAANVSHLHRLQVSLPATVDSSPIYLHQALVRGARHDTIVVDGTYGRTMAIDANSGRILWVYTPPGYDEWAGGEQITVSSPLADPDGSHVYSASPNGLIHKLSLATGQEVTGGGWPARVTLEAKHEKLGAALNIDGPDLLVATSGYLGDAPPYQGHVVAIDRAGGAVRAVFNTLCANRRRLQVPSSCPASDSAILSRGGPVVERGGRRILISTGNGPWNGASDFGDSVLELSFPSLSLLASYTPVDQERLNDSDLDLGSSAPAPLSPTRMEAAGKDGIVRVLKLGRLNGRSRRDHTLLGGEVQQLPVPGGGEPFSAPAVWRRAGRTTMFVGAEHATAAYVLRHGRLYLAWRNANPGTSPVLAGGLLYVYDPESGGVNVYRPGSPRPIIKLPGEPGHWNSPIVVDGHVIEPEGDANAHRTSGTLDIFSIG